MMSMVLLQCSSVIHSSYYLKRMYVWKHNYYVSSGMNCEEEPCHIVYVMILRLICGVKLQQLKLKSSEVSFQKKKCVEGTPKHAMILAILQIKKVNHKKNRQDKLSFFKWQKNLWYSFYSKDLNHS